MSKPEEQARRTIDAALAAAGWQVQDVDQANLDAGPGVAVREFSLGGGVTANGEPLHGLPAASSVVIPANGVVVFTRDAGD